MRKTEGSLSSSVLDPIPSLVTLGFLFHDQWVEVADCVGFEVAVNSCMYLRPKSDDSLQTPVQFISVGI